MAQVHVPGKQGRDPGGSCGRCVFMAGRSQPVGAVCSWLVLLSLWAAACSWLVLLSLWALRVHGWSFSACGRCVFMADPSQPVGRCVFMSDRS